jgi:hypothetical protein
MYNRSVPIAGINKFTYGYFRERLAACAAAGNLNFHIHEVHRTLLSVDIQIDIWSKNVGSVNAICDQFLAPVAQNPSSDNIFYHTVNYTDGIRAWIRAEKASR